MLEKVFKAIKKAVKSTIPDPSKQEAVVKLAKSMEERHPDNKFLITLLGIFAPKDEIFRKDYLYVKPKEEAAIEPMLWNQDGLFDGLPMLPEKVLRKKNRL